jgi:hypothetical protein
LRENGRPLPRVRTARVRRRWNQNQVWIDTREDGERLKIDAAPGADREAARKMDDLFER